MNAWQRLTSRAVTGVTRRVWGVGVAAVGALVASALNAGPAFAAEPFASLADRLPASTEAIVAVNVDKVLASEYGKQRHWAENMAEGWARRPQVVVPGVSVLLMGSDFAPTTVDTTWELTLMRMATMPEVKAIAMAEGGSIDRLWDREAVLSPLGAYFVPVDKSLLAVLSPANRKTAVSWVRHEVKPGGVVASEYIKGVLDGLGEQTDVVMAMDLKEAFPNPNIRRFLAESEVEGLKGKDVEKLAGTLATLTGLRVEVAITDEARGSVRVDFGSPAEGLAEVAKPLMAAVLDRAGMQLPDVSGWEFTVEGNAINGKGSLGEKGLQRLLSVVQSPAPALVAAAQSSTEAAPPADPGVASQRYFRSVSMVLDGLTEGQPPAMSDVRTWLVQAAKRIDNFPILNVDPALVEWGALVSVKLKQVAGVATVGQSEINSRVAGVMVGGYDNYGIQTKINIENSNRLRRQASMDQRAVVQGKGLEVLAEINGTRQKVRAEMVAKYKIEF